MDASLYKMIEASVEDDETLSSSFDVFDTCKTFSGTGSILE